MKCRLADVRAAKGRLANAGIGLDNAGMKLTLYTDYSLRVLLYLNYKKGAPATITELAEFYKISRNHLVKVVHNLGVIGFVQTTRGKRGGIRLAEGAEKISIGDIVRKTEPDLDLLECFDARTDHCTISRGCQLKSFLFNARNAFMKELDRHTLADISHLPASSGVKTYIDVASLRTSIRKKKKET